MLNPNNTYSNYNTNTSKKRNKSINNISKGNIYDSLYPEKANNNLFNIKFKIMENQKIILIKKLVITKINLIQI